MLKRSLLAVGLATLLVAAAVAQNSSAPNDKQGAPSLNTDKEKVSYALGWNQGSQMHRLGVEVDPAILMRGLSDALSGSNPAMTADEVQKILTELQTEVMGKQRQLQTELADKNKKEAQAFLKQNQSKPGVVTLPSGLQYKILKQGSGPKPTLNDTVVSHYQGTLINGNVFDSSYQRGQPATFPVNAVIKGWIEALQLMPVGSKWQLFVPAELAYGEQGRPGIEPNATLIFEVELISIGKKES